MSENLLANLLLFTRVLRSGGVAVRAGGVPDAVNALAAVGVARKSDVREALRTVLLSRHDDLSRFDAIFDRFWRAWPDATDQTTPRPMHVPPRVRATLKVTSPGVASNAHEAGSRDADTPVTLQSYSAEEAWRRKDFAAFTPEDVARARAAMAMLAWHPGLRVTRRWRSGRGQTIDLRRLLRANSRYGGEILTIPRRVRRVARRPLVLICDVSGSMEPYARMLLLFAHAMAHGERRVEVFVFSTELTRVTRQVSDARVDAAWERVRSVVRDWSGGTRIGDALRRFNAHWARRVLRHRPAVLLISDGWDLGDPATLAREVAWLQRSAFRLIWLNPLIGSPGYEPLTRGMKAALPYVDDFLSVRDMSSLEALASHLNALSGGRRGRPEWN